MKYVESRAQWEHTREAEDYGVPIADADLPPSLRVEFATLEARIVELERERDEARGVVLPEAPDMLDNCCSYCGKTGAHLPTCTRAQKAFARIDGLLDSVERLTADLDEAVGLLGPMAFLAGAQNVCGVCCQMIRDCDRHGGCHGAKVRAYVARHPTPDKEPRR